MSHEEGEMTEALRLAAEVKELAYEMGRQDVSAALTDYALKRQELQSAKETAREFEAAVDRLAALAEQAAGRGCPACNGTGVIRTYDSAGLVDQFGCDLCGDDDA